MGVGFLNFEVKQFSVAMEEGWNAADASFVKFHGSVQILL